MNENINELSRRIRTFIKLRPKCKFNIISHNTALHNILMVECHSSFVTCNVCNVMNIFCRNEQELDYLAAKFREVYRDYLV